MIESEIMRFLATVLLIMLLAAPAITSIFSIVHARPVPQRISMKKLFLYVSFPTLLGVSASLWVSVAFIIGTYLIGLLAVFSLLLGALTSFGLTLVLSGATLLKRPMHKNGLRNIGTFLLIGCLIIPGSDLAGLSLSSRVIEQCDQIQRQTGEQIIVAVKAYRGDYSSYPEKLSDLFPTYLSQQPIPLCDRWAGFSFELVECANGDNILYIIDSARSNYQRYNFRTQEWTGSIGNFLDHPYRYCTFED